MTKPHLSDAEFDETSWHDVHIHGIAVIHDSFELLLDIDYIEEWLCSPIDKHASFKLAPATLLFRNYSGLELAARSDMGPFAIQELRREDWFQTPGAVAGTWLWTIDCEHGTIQFRATGYELYLRADFVVSDNQCLGFRERGLPTFVRGEAGERPG